jgi:hypothetical protein
VELDELYATHGNSAAKASRQHYGRHSKKLKEAIVVFDLERKHEVSNAVDCSQLRSGPSKRNTPGKADSRRCKHQ